MSCFYPHPSPYNLLIFLTEPLGWSTETVLLVLSQGDVRLTREVTPLIEASTGVRGGTGPTGRHQSFGVLTRTSGPRTLVFPRSGCLTEGEGKGGDLGSQPETPWFSVTLKGLSDVIAAIKKLRHHPPKRNNGIQYGYNKGK